MSRYASPKDTVKGVRFAPRRVVLTGAAADTNIAVAGAKKGDLVIEAVAHKTDGSDILVVNGSFTSDGNVQFTSDTTGHKVLLKWAPSKGPKVRAVSISVAPSSGTLDLSNGETQQLTVTATFEDDRGQFTKDITQADAPTITYESANAAVATVNSRGLVTAVGVGGPINITATYQGLTDTYAVTVAA